ncbi:hypothetical protein D9M73_264340 [compost metagenome]
MENGETFASAAWKAASPRLINWARMNWAMASGMTMYISTDSSRVSHGTGIDDTPSSRATIGAKANTITRSLSATWVRVKLALPLHRLLHTNTIAVQGAAPSRISPAM